MLFISRNGGWSVAPSGVRAAGWLVADCAQDEGARGRDGQEEAGEAQGQAGGQGAAEDTRVSWVTGRPAVWGVREGGSLLTAGTHP